MARTPPCSFSAIALVVLACAACGSNVAPSSTSAPNDGGGSDSSEGTTSSGGGGGGGIGGGCVLVIEQIPATLIVSTATGEALACDATLSLVGYPTGASGEGSFANVPSTVAGTCTYELSPGSQGVNAYGVGTFTVQIEQTGYVTQTVPNVATGDEAAPCAAPSSPATTTHVTLQPLPEDAAIGVIDAG